MEIITCKKTIRVAEDKRGRISYVVVKLPVVCNYVEVEHRGLCHNNNNGNKAEESMVKHLSVAHRVGRLGLAGWPVV